MRTKTAVDITTAPNSDNEEGKAEQKKKKLDALAEANRRRARMFARECEEMFGACDKQSELPSATSTPRSSRGTAGKLQILT